MIIILLQSHASHYPLVIIGSIVQASLKDRVPIMCCTIIGNNWTTSITFPLVYCHIWHATIIPVVHYHHTSIHHHLCLVTLFCSIMPDGQGWGKICICISILSSRVLESFRNKSISYLYLIENGTFVCMLGRKRFDSNPTNGTDFVEIHWCVNVCLMWKEGIRHEYLS